MNKKVGIAFLLCIVATLFAQAQVDTNKALSVGRNALHFKDYLLSIRYFSSAISASPEKAEPYFFRALAKHSLGDYIGAEIDCDSCLLRNQFMYNAYFLRGISRHALGKDSLAALDYEKVLYNNPDHQGALHNSALIHLTNKEYDALDKDIARLERFYPQYLPTYFIHSGSMLERQDTTTAISLLEKVKSLDALSSEPYRLLSSIYYSKNKIPEALKELNGGLALNNKDKRLYTLRGIINYKIHNIREALEDYTQAISIDSDDRTARFNRAQLRMRVGDMNAAIEDYDVVLAIEPKDQIARFNRGLLRKELGIYKGAVSDFDAILKSYPTFLPALMARAETHKSTGNESGYKKDIREITRLQQLAATNRAALPSSPAQDEDATRSEQDQNIEKFRMLIHNSSSTDFTSLYNENNRGELQDREVSLDAEPLLRLSFYEFLQTDAIPIRIRDRAVERALSNLNPDITPQIVLYTPSLSQSMIAEHLQRIDSLQKQSTLTARDALVLAIDLETTKDFDSANAIYNTRYNDTKDPLWLLLRSTGNYLSYRSEQTSDQATKQENKTKDFLGKSSYNKLDAALKTGQHSPHLQQAFNDSKQLLTLWQESLVAMYNHGTLLYHVGQYQEAVKVLTQVCRKDPTFAAAFFNLALAQYASGDILSGSQNMSLAGSKGISRAYAILKRMQ